ncbi:MAG: hypothetical protein KAQ68_00295 [Clostridiales bacterium]|nr:hypothetical protein [Clostridiales bacterium]
MFDIDKALDEIRSIDVSPSSTQIDKAKQTVLHEESELDARRKAKRKRTVRISHFLAIPAAAAAMFILLIRLAVPTPVSYYSVDINPNIQMAVDQNGIVCSIEESDLEIAKDEIVGQSIEYAISNIIITAQDTGYIKDNENVLIGCFGEDEYNNISKNQVRAYLSTSLREDIVLMSIHGSLEEWENADKEDMSAGLYTLHTLYSNMMPDQDITLDGLITLIENEQNKDVQTLLEENKEPIHYKAPQLTYTLDGDNAVFAWEPIDFKKINYDGDITYQLVSAESKQDLLQNPTTVSTHTFASWDEQPTDYTLAIDGNTAGRYYGIIAHYDDGKRVVDSFAEIGNAN